MLRLRSVLGMRARLHPAYDNPHIVVRPRSTHASMGTVDSEDGPARGRLRRRRARRLHRGLHERRAGRRHAATARLRRNRGPRGRGRDPAPVAPVTSVFGINAPAGTGSFSGGPLAGPQQRSGLAPPAPAPAPRGLAGPGVSSSFGNPPGAGGAGDMTVPAASQLAGLGALPGLADLPSLAGLANMPAP